MVEGLPLMAPQILPVRLWIVLAASLIIVAGCSDPQIVENEALREEIIDVHDQAMDKIGYMFVLERQLKDLQPGAGNTEESIDTSVTALQEANRAMFAWMNQYQTLSVADDLAIDNRYRREQLERIEMVGRITSQAILEAEHILSAD